MRAVHPFLQSLGRVLSCLALLSLATGCEFPFLARDEVPFDLKTIIPKEWTPITKLIKIDVDDDQANEWLLFYRYDMSAQRKEQGNVAGPIGGVVFDPQIDPKTGVSMFARYDLLPDIRTGKGQGFLGEEKCEARVYRIGDRDSGSEELAVFGYGYGPASPVYLSIFRREKDSEQGYHFKLLGHFYGNGGITVEPASGNSEPIQKIAVKTRLNERSLISERAIFERRDNGQGSVAYELQPQEICLEFTYGIPENPYYPEAAVLAYYQLMNAGRSSEAGRFILPEHERASYQLRLQESNLATNSPTTPIWPQGRILPLTLAYTGASKILPGQNEMPFYHTTVEVEESIGVTNLWEVIGLLDGGCGAEICWQLMSWHRQ